MKTPGRRPRRGRLRPILRRRSLRTGRPRLLSLGAPRLRRSSGGLRVGALEDEAAPVHPDAVLLGFGLDEHIASLFPGSTGVDAALALSGEALPVRLTPDPLPPEAPFARITLTMGSLVRTLQAARAAAEVTTPLRVLLGQQQVPVIAYILQEAQDDASDHTNSL